MSFSGKGSPEEPGTLVDSLTIENSSLNEGNLPDLSTNEYQALNELSEELTLHSDEMETEEIVMENQEIVEHEEEVESEELTTEEFIENKHQIDSSEDIIPEMKNVRSNVVPPLRPLTIAPKPAKIPLSVKPVAGQQLLLLQGAGAGQAIKLVSAPGQELNFANIIGGRPVALKPTFKTIGSQGGNLSIIQQKPVVMNKFVTLNKPVTKSGLTTFTNKQTQHFVLVQKSDPQQVKLVQAQGGIATISGPTKTVTLQQAQEMGLLGNNAKIVQQAQSAPKQTVLLTKTPQKTLKLVPQVTPTLVSTNLTSSINTKTITTNTIKTPTKILPAGSVTIPKGSTQKIIFKATPSNQTIIPSGQLIQVATSQALASGQLHQINIPGKGMQFIKFVSASTTECTPTTATVTTMATTTKLVSSSTTANVILTDVKPAAAVSKIAPKPLKPSATTISTVSTGQTVGTVVKPISVTADAGGTPQMVVLPSSYAQLTPIAPVAKVAIPAIPNPRQPAKQSQTRTVTPPPAPREEVDANGMRPRKPCNCTKSQCLKLYCDCFANGEFCYMCKCINCFNDLENEEHRNRAIKACLERNPHAFKPKIGKAKDVAGDTAIRKHTKGCNCKRSGCLKNYCECYEAKIACSNNCKCIGCRNIEDTMEKKTLRHLVNMEKVAAAIMSQDRYSPNKDTGRLRRSSNTRKQTVNYITDEVIEATCQCMLTICDNAEENMQDEEMTKRLIIEEFGRCLTEIIDCTSSHS